ncbi:uncharacterized protein DS421_11g338900 [Arachis hypogaea]|nr:uncharacterized protein DS421_11g338900 [Arachis hypogaea]
MSPRRYVLRGGSLPSLWSSIRTDTHNSSVSLIGLVSITSARCLTSYACVPSWLRRVVPLLSLILLAWSKSASCFCGVCVELYFILFYFNYCI